MIDGRKIYEKTITTSGGDFDVWGTLCWNTIFLGGLPIDTAFSLQVLGVTAWEGSDIGRDLSLEELPAWQAKHGSLLMETLVLDLQSADENARGV